MKKNQTFVNSLTRNEKHLLDRYIGMDEWQFKLLLDECSLISSKTMAFEKKGELTRPVRIFIYGLEATRIYP